MRTRDPTRYCMERACTEMTTCMSSGKAASLRGMGALATPCFFHRASLIVVARPARSNDLKILGGSSIG